MDVVVLLEIHVAPENVQELKRTLAEMLAETRAHDGCVSIEALQNQEERGNVVLIQRWKSRSHYEEYAAWRAETGAAEAASAKLSASYSTRYFGMVGV